MNAKLIRTEKRERGATKYYFECSKCGNEYYRWSYNKRTTCLCSDCYKKRQREQAQAWQKRKLQEYADKVLENIKAEIDKARYIDKDTRICKNALAGGLEVAMEIINKYKAESEEE